MALLLRAQNVSEPGGECEGRDLLTLQAEVAH